MFEVDGVLLAYQGKKGLNCFFLFKCFKIIHFYCYLCYVYFVTAVTQLPAPPTPANATENYTISEISNTSTMAWKLLPTNNQIHSLIQVPDLLYPRINSPKYSVHMAATKNSNPPFLTKPYTPPSTSSNSLCY